MTPHQSLSGSTGSSGVLSGGLPGVSSGGLPCGSSGGLPGVSSSGLPSGSSKEPSTVTQTTANYSYNVTPADLAREQQAFQPGEGVSNNYTYEYSYILLYFCTFAEEGAS